MNCNCSWCQKADLWFANLNGEQKARLLCKGGKAPTYGALLRRVTELERQLLQKTTEANNLRLRVEEICEVPPGTFGGNS